MNLPKITKFTYNCDLRVVIVGNNEGAIASLKRSIAGLWEGLPDEAFNERGTMKRRAYLRSALNMAEEPQVWCTWPRALCMYPGCGVLVGLPDSFVTPGIVKSAGTCWEVDP